MNDASHRKDYQKIEADVCRRQTLTENSCCHQILHLSIASTDRSCWTCHRHWHATNLINTTAWRDVDDVAHNRKWIVLTSCPNVARIVHVSYDRLNWLQFSFLLHFKYFYIIQCLTTVFKELLETVRNTKSIWWKPAYTKSCCIELPQGYSIVVQLVELSIHYKSKNVQLYIRA